MLQVLNGNPELPALEHHTPFIFASPGSADHSNVGNMPLPTYFTCRRHIHCCCVSMAFGGDENEMILWGWHPVVASVAL